MIKGRKVGGKTLKKLVLFGFIVLLPVLNIAEAQALPHIQGRSIGYGWTIGVWGSKGTFRADGLTWEIEYIFKNGGLAGFSNTLWFLGRRPDNFALLHIYTNQAGNSFTVLYYNYKDSTYRADQFGGSYDINGLGAASTFMPGYVPRGKVPDYMGLDFLIFSSFSNIVPAGGKVSYPGLQLTIYPVFYVPVTPVWSEIWAIAIDPATQHTYFLIFYTITTEAWVIDLWSGQINNLPLGQVLIAGGQITVARNVVL